LFDLIRKIVQTKTVTKTNVFDEAPSCFRGKPVFSSNECTGCGKCTTFCPATAIDLHKTKDTITLSISYASCIFCGICAEECETKMIQATNEYRLAARDKEHLIISANFPVMAKEPILAGKGGE
jgi:formate hydrogenlyase subunit 6/NADH:ubiquinone oxidoreductase subunit I